MNSAKSVTRKSARKIQSDQKPRRFDHAGQDDEQVELRHAGPDLDEALEAEVHPAAVIALHRAGGDAE
ncbi:MAG TPA: hypothetical protein VE033_03845, partial [Acetobacteraceae bacterium]|nr:hypothetical protein [Acetobacteraceae bacterium]